MPSAFDESIKARYFHYLDKEMSFIARHPNHAHQGYDTAAQLIACLEQFEFVTQEEAKILYRDLETALGIAVASMPRSR